MAKSNPDSSPKSSALNAAGNVPDPAAIMAMATGYWNSVSLLTAVRLGLFNVLAEGAQTAARIASCIGGDSRAVGMLLDACAALELVERSADPAAPADSALYTNSRAADAYLVDGRPGYIGSAILWSADQYLDWARLPETVKTGKPAAPPLHLGDDPELTRTFVLGMHNRAAGIARGVIHFIDLQGCGSLLDVGGGPGTYSVLLTGKYPELQATVLDLPGVLTVAKELIKLAGASERVLLRPGDAVTDSYGEAEFDAVLFSGVLHQMSPATILDMLRKARRALKPHGKVILCDIMLDSSRVRPAFAALFSLQMLLSSADGAVFSVDDVTGWLAEAGYERVEVRQLPPPMPYVVVTGYAPDPS